MKNKNHKITKSTWWIYGILGIIVYISLIEFDIIWVLALITALNVAFWGYLLNYFLDYIYNKISIKKPTEKVKTNTKELKLPPLKINTSSYNYLYPKAAEYTTEKKEKTNKIVSEPDNSYQTETKSKIHKRKNLKPKKKPKNKEVLPDSIKNNTSNESNVKYVNYKLNFDESENSFPILKIPNNKCVVRSYRLGSNKKRGYKESSFQKSIEYFFSNDFKILGNTRLNTGKNTRPFEPDIALIGNTNKNIRIDIEIDEPYAGITRQTTHCLGDDTNRDNYFKDRGWIVLRFSEYQIHTQEKQCLKFIADIILNINPLFEISNELKAINSIEKENVWNVVKAQKWEKTKYREQYLNHEFKSLKEHKETLKRDFNQQEIEEEKFVIKTSLGKEDDKKNISFNSSNWHKRDKRIKFYSEKHIYTIDGVPVPSASSIIGRFFPEFDMQYWSERKASTTGITPEEIAKMWSDKGKYAREKGTFLHEQIENYFLGIDYVETEEFGQFQNFISHHNNLIPYRSEWRVFDDYANIAGTIDLITSNGSNYDIYDWKRSKKIINTFNGLPIEQNQWQQGVGGLKHIDDTSYNRYCLQQSLYKYILEKNYQIKIENMFLIVIHPDNDNYYKVKVPNFDKEIKYILKTV